MRTLTKSVLVLLLLAAGLPGADTTAAEIQSLRQQLAQQSAQIEQLRSQLDEQGKVLDRLA